jgi:hypothetical protein
MSFRIYYSDSHTNQPFCADCDTLSQALILCASARESGHRMVTMVAEDLNQVGKPGVAGVENGKLPDGSDYDWTKTDRVGAAFKSK